MTKLREPVSIENALLLTLGRLTIERAAEVTGRQPHYLRAASDPDKPDQLLSVRDMELLDLASHADFGDGFPLYEALGRRLESSAAERFADQAAIGRACMAVAKETGDATAAMIAASLPGASIPELETALRELEEADASTDGAIAVVRSALNHARAELRPPDTS